MKKTSHNSTWRYRHNPAYRMQTITRKRIRYQRGVVQGGGKLRCCLSKLALVHVYGRTREAALRGAEPQRMLSFTTKEIASIMGYHPVVVQGWQRRGKFPRGPYRTTNRLPFPVFSLAQATELVRVMGEHQKTTQYFYDSDQSVIAALFAAINQTTPTEQPPPHENTKQAKEHSRPHDDAKQHPPHEEQKPRHGKRVP